MSAVPQKYQPTTRLIDDPDRLEELYCRDGLTVREIANQHTDYSPSAVYQALDEYGIIDEESDERQMNNPSDGSGGGVTGPVGASERGFDPPTSERSLSLDSNNPSVEWSSFS